MTYDGSEPQEGPVAGEPPPAGLVSLRVVLRAVRRHRVLCLTMAAVGLVVGAGFHSIVPRKYVATTSVYLVEPAGSDPTVAYATDLSLLQTRAVAERAVAAGHLAVGVGALLASYRGEQTGTAVMSIRLSAPTPSAALARDNAVAAAFLAFRGAEVNAQTRAQIEGMESDAKALQGQVGTLSRQLAQTSGSRAGSALARQRTKLSTEETTDIAELGQLQGQIQQDQLDVASVAGSSRVIDAASLGPVPGTKLTLKDGLAGLVGGLGAGIVLVGVGSLLSDRLRDRRDVADALGAPVELSVGDPPGSRFGRGQHLARQLARPDPDLELVVGRLRAHLEGSRGRALAVVSIGADRTAALAVCLLGAQLFSEGADVVLADMAAGRPLAELLDLDPEEEGPQLIETGPDGGDCGGRVRALALPESPLRLASVPPPPDSDAAVMLVTVDTALGVDHLRPWAARAVVVFRAGRANATLTATVGQQLRNAGLELQAAILVGADPGDESLGMVARPSGPPPEASSSRPVAARSAR